MSPLPVSADRFVRDARPADSPDLARIQVARWRAGYADLVPDRVLAEITHEDTERRCQEHWASSLAAPPTSRHRVLVAVAAGAGGERVAAGFVSFGPATDPERWPGTDAELYEFCVDPGRTGHGHGSRLLNAAAATMAGDGFTAAYTWVLERDAAAREFLETAGWAPDGARRALDMGIPVPTIRLHTALNPPQ